jgi:hypothetical protein
MKYLLFKTIEFKSIFIVTKTVFYFLTNHIYKQIYSEIRVKLMYLLFKLLY